MIDKVLARAAVRAVTGHPPLTPQRCVNALQGKVRCDACVKACPAGALIRPEKGEADWEKCVNCDLCAVACPSGALGMTGDRVKKAAELLAGEQETCALGCELTEAPLTYRGWCLASLKWEMICALALGGNVELLRGDCANCPRKDALPGFEKTIARARAFLGAERFDARVRVTDAGANAEAVAGRALTRREAFGAVFSGLRRTASAALPEDWKLGEDGLFFRLMLVRRIEALPPDAGDFGWVGPVFTERCWACGICARVCANGAILPVEREGVWHMVHQPCLCAGCGACMAVCPEKAISAISEYRLPPGARCQARRVQTGVCCECGAPVKPEQDGTLCVRCRAKKPRR